jgi:predicted nucleotidyltransferase
MMKNKTKHISTLIKLNIKEIDPDAQIILYGSRARGDERSDSDWDILVLTDYPVDIKKESVFRDHLYNLELETGEPFSIFVYSKTDWNTKQSVTPFYYNVTNQGIIL